MRSTATTPNAAGVPNSRLNRSASSRLTPLTKSHVNVIPDRLIPGNTAAPWSSPNTKAS